MLRMVFDLGTGWDELVLATTDLGFGLVDNGLATVVSFVSGKIHNT